MLNRITNITTILPELYRVIKPNGKLGITDFFVQTPLPDELNKLLAYFGATAPKHSQQNAIELLGRVGFGGVKFEDQTGNIRKLLAKARTLLPGLGFAQKFMGPELERNIGISMDDLPQVMDTIEGQIEDGNLCYGILVASK